MANLSPILCVVGDDDEGSHFKTALVALNISNPLHCVVGATNAMEFLEHNHPQNSDVPILVFLSLAAPDANRLAAWFEAHPTHRPAGLIAMTVLTDMRPIIQAYHLGVTAFLEWPLKPDDIRNAINSNPDLQLETFNGKLAISRL